jgi:hypothetical protein
MRLPNEIIGTYVKLWIKRFGFAPKVKILDMNDGVVTMLFGDGSIVYGDQNAIYGWWSTV